MRNRKYSVIIKSFTYIIAILYMIVEYFQQHVNNMQMCLQGGFSLIYDKIKELCMRKGMSVRELERQAGLGTGAVSKWNTSSPTIDRLKSVAEVLEVSISELVDE